MTRRQENVATLLITGAQAMNKVAKLDDGRTHTLRRTWVGEA
jgi:hypothetical protein